MYRRDPIGYGLMLLGYGAGHCRWWIVNRIPDYDEWSWWKQAVLRLAILGLSALLTWWAISWRISWTNSQADPGPYWFLWSMGLVVGYVIEQIHAYVDKMFP